METFEKNSRVVAALFHDATSAELAYQTASERGYDERKINLIMSDETHRLYFSENNGRNRNAEGGAEVGSTLGGALGAIAAAVAAIGTTVVVPGFGIVLAGPIAAAMAGAGAGGVTGGLIGALVGWGLPEEKVRDYTKAIKEGGVLIGLQPLSDRDIKYFERYWINHPDHPSAFSQSGRSVAA